MSIFKNPMILMGLVSVVMIFGMPKLMENSTYFWSCSCSHAYLKAHFTDCLQWTRRPGRKWKRCSRTHSVVLKALLRRSRTSTWLGSCLESLTVPDQRRRSERMYTKWNRHIYRDLQTSYDAFFCETRHISTAVPRMTLQVNLYTDSFPELLQPRARRTAS